MLGGDGHGGPAAQENGRFDKLVYDGDAAQAGEGEFSDISGTLLWQLLPSVRTALTQHRCKLWHDLVSP